jgi:hypothetical protein
MKRSFVAAALVLVSSSVFSQDIYQIAELSTADLNGTSRYVGMGGAMGALGGDLSTMSSSPAATGLYRRSDVAVTASLASQPGGYEFDGKHNKHVSFDQLGFVYCFPVMDKQLKFINFGINYHKQRDFNQLVASSADDLSGTGYASQTWQLADLCNFWGGSNVGTPLTDMAYQSYLLGDASSNYSPYSAKSHYYNKARWGSNQAYDFNLSFNVSDRWYFGITASVYNVVQKSSMAYTEDLLYKETSGEYTNDGFYTLTNNSSLKGTGYDAKFGMIVRPFSNSNFKIGLTLTTPIYYELTYRNTATLSSYDTRWNLDENISVRDQIARMDYDYKVRTPWKVGVSVGNTFFGKLAVGAEYEFADYSSSSVSYGDDFDGWNDAKDRELNRQADKFLKGTHTLKVGAELTPVRNFYVRAGYNYVTSSIDKDAFLNQYINSASIDAASSTDYLNISSVKRYTAGIGVKFGSFYADASWLYQCQNGKLYAFSASSDGSVYPVPNCDNVCPSRHVKLNKSQIALTLGYRF